MRQECRPTTVARHLATVVIMGLVSAGCGTTLTFDTTVPATPTPVDDLAGGSEATTDPTPTPAPTPIPSPTPTPPPPAGQLTVTDANAIGTLGDDLLSLSEAVQLANGQLVTSQLSAAEAEFVEGEPGPEMADTIQMGLEDGASVTVPDTDGWVIQVFGNDGDTLAGGGTTLLGSGITSASHNVMLLGSNNLTVEGFVFEGVTQGIGIESAGRQIGGITIRNNRFVDVSIHDVIMQNSTLAGGVVDTVIDSNSFETTRFSTDFHAFVTAQAGTGVPGESTEFTFARGIAITNNTMNAAPGTVARCVAISGGFVDFSIAGQVDGAQLEDVTIESNTMTGCSVGIQIAAGHGEHTDATVTDSTIRRVSIVNNALANGDTAIAIYGAYMQPAPPSFNYSVGVTASLTNNLVDDVTISGITVDSYTRGIQLTGAEFGVGGSGSAQLNTLNAFTFGDDTVGTNSGQLCEIRVNVGSLAFDNTVQTLCPSL